MASRPPGSSTPLIEALRKEGIPILRQHDKDVQDLVETLAYRSQIAGHEVPVMRCRS